MSEVFQLIGGGPQGTLLGQIEYIVQSNDNTDSVPQEDKFKYIDDLSLLQLVCLAGLLVEYNFLEHVASDVGIGELFLPPEAYSTQETLNSVAHWTEQNFMQLNEKKCNYMQFSRSSSHFSTRLSINNVQLEKVSEFQVLGVWISDNLTWEKNCKELCKRAYSRLTMLTKLRYVGTSVEDLIVIYSLYIRSILEYCSVAYHSSLTQAQSDKIERVQKTCLRVILSDMYVNYEAALEMCNLEKLSTRREERCLKFALKCLKHETNQKLFPYNERNLVQNLKNKERFKVNWARTEAYRKSAIPHCQRLLNKHFK